MNKFIIGLSLEKYLLIGLLFWGLPAVIIYPVLVPGFIGILIPFYVWPMMRQKRKQVILNNNYQGKRRILLSFFLFISVSYLIIDAIYGRQKLSQNLFLTSFAVDSVVTNAEEMIGKGRGMFDLLGAIMIFLPFALLDVCKKRKDWLSIFGLILVVTYVFYETGVSRGYFLVAIFSLLIASGSNNRNIFFALLGAFIFFGLASFWRGDADNFSIIEPFFEAIAWPYINLGIYLEKGCGSSNIYEMLLQVIQKFAPSFIIEKNIFSFNIEITKCIYPSMEKSISSISIYTYMAELHYYGIGVVSGIIVSCLLLLFSIPLSNILETENLHTLKLFVGLMLIILLRSRILDIFSILIALFIFLMFFKGNSPTILRHFLPLKKRNETS
jgi:hypothetical protein